MTIAIGKLQEILERDLAKHNSRTLSTGLLLQLLLTSEPKPAPKPAEKPEWPREIHSKWRGKSRLVGTEAEYKKLLKTGKYVALRGEVPHWPQLLSNGNGQHGVFWNPYEVSEAKKAGWGAFSGTKEQELSLKKLGRPMCLGGQWLEFLDDLAKGNDKALLTAATLQWQKSGSNSIRAGHPTDFLSDYYFLPED